MGAKLEGDDRQLVFRVWRRVWPYRWHLVPAMLCMVILASTTGGIAYLVKDILDKVFIEKDEMMLRLMPLAILAVFVIRGAAYFIQSYLMEAVGQRVIRGYQVELYNHYLSLDLSFFHTEPMGNVLSQVIYDSQLVKGSASDVLTGLFKEGFTVIVLVGVLFYHDWKLALFSLVGMPAAGFLIYKFGRRMRKLSRVRQEKMGDLVAHLEETISGMRIVKAFGMETYEKARFRGHTKKVLKNNLRSAAVRSISSPAMDLVAGGVMAGIVWYGGASVIKGTMTPGEFFSFLTALLMAYQPIRRLTGINNSLQEGLAAAKRIYRVLDRPPLIRNAPGARELPPIQEAIRFENLDYAYGPDLPRVLKNINLTVKSGERIALVGKSGSGKTTLANLVPRFFDPTKGRVTIDGVDLREVTQKSLRSQMAMVTQEIILFNDTARNNIAYGRLDRSPGELKEAAKAANALEFIEALPEGFDSIIGDKGAKLSGGQRQRMSIARSILKNAPILILDEATSALDSESELAVQEALENLMKGRTSLVIAHRLSTIRTADRIVVLKEGEIVEEGKHADLLALDGEYARLYALQFQNE